MNYIYPEFKALRTTAASSIGEGGGVIPAGKSKMRLVFGEDPRFHILAKTIKPSDVNKYRPGDYVEKGFWTKQKYVVFSAGKQNVLVSVVSLSRRLHLDEDTIINSAALGNRLGNLILTTVPKIQKKLVVTDLSKHLKNAELVQKVADRVMKGEVVGYEGKPADVDKPFIARVVKGVLKFETLGEKIADGHFGSVFAAGQKEVVKKPCVDKGQEAVNQLKNEYEILTGMLPRNRSVLGLQSHVHKVVVLNSDHQEVGFWSLTTRFERDYFDYITKTQNRNFEAVMSEIHQLLFVLKFLEENQVLHGDIKPNNILLGQVQNELRLFLIDFGGSRRIEPKKEEVKPECGTYPYTSKEDRDQIDALQLKLHDALIENDPHVSIPDIRAELVTLGFKIDAFSMGSVLFNALTNDYPYPLYAHDNSPNFTQKMNPLVAGFPIPDKLVNLITRMVDPLPSNRPTGKQAFNEFKLLLNDYPVLKAKLTAKEG